MFAIKPTEVAPLGQVVKVGIVGCGMVTQVVHIPTLNSLSHHFRITYLHDVSADAMKHSQLKAAGATKPKTTKEFHELCISAEVDLELLASNHAFHASEVIIALKANKHVFTENPIALTLQDTDRIIAADQAAGGSKVFVGYMRRYAAAFVDAVKEALQTELGVTATEERKMMWDYLSMLGSHDLSAMREIIGMPTGFIWFSPCATTESPFWSAMVQYPGFTVSYESGIDQVPRFDASIEIFGDKKTVKVVIDTPFIKGLPTVMVVKESLLDGSYRESAIRRTIEDPFTLELQEVNAWVTEGRTPKTTPSDARQDLEILGMPTKAGASQEGR